MTKSQIEQFIQTAQGTCLSQEEVCNRIGITEDEIFISDWNIIQSEIMLCEVCGWWVEAHEIVYDNYENVCSDCDRYND